MRSWTKAKALSSGQFLHKWLSLASELLINQGAYDYLVQTVHTVLDPPLPAPSDELERYMRARMTDELSHPAVFDKVMRDFEAPSVIQPHEKAAHIDPSTNLCEKGGSSSCTPKQKGVWYFCI